MHSKLLSILILALLGASQTAQAAPWTYRGSLNDGGKPANGSYDLRLTLTDAAGVRAIGQPLTLYGVAVKDGNFAADVDFGVDLSNAPALKLKTEVAQGGSGFVSLGEATRFDPMAVLAGICWDTTGNVVAAGEFLGATNNVAVEIKANNLRAAQFKAAGTTASYGDAPQVALGSSANLASGIGATVGGGGATRDLSGNPISIGLNAATARFATVSGGFGNSAINIYSTVGGGITNTAGGNGGTVGGGATNQANGDFNTIAGGQNNTTDAARSTVAGAEFNRASADNAAVSGGLETKRGDWPRPLSADLAMSPTGNSAPSPGAAATVRAVTIRGQVGILPGCALQSATGRRVVPVQAMQTATRAHFCGRMTSSPISFRPAPTNSW
ncbi:MAG: hypothetical protein IPO66_04060 [Rhodanobacteraceae bacterium]|nr:hypothetical protein [Rhodanobacteraceae bacterium]